MPSTEELLAWFRTLPPAGVYAALWATAYVENLFPPAPSDVIMLFIATLIGVGTIGHVEAITVATLGSTMGFLTAYYIGRRYGRRMVESKRLPFVTAKSVERVDKWFAKYGYWVIVANRFLAGTRAVISFFAGIARLEPVRTTALCAISALVWNTAVIEFGAFLGSNWRRGAHVLENYGIAVSIILAAVALFFLGRWWIRKRKSNK
jgi:membrane protein DedA with SNARE-associated domain